MSKVMICGYGSAGQYVLDFLLKDHRITPEMLECIYIVSRKSVEEVTPRITISTVSASISERYIPVKYASCDFDNIEMMAEVIDDAKPDVIVYTGRFASGLKYGSFSYPNNIGYGVWMPLSTVYIYKLMKAVKLSGVKTKVINTSFPDGVNPLLASIGLAPYTGAGNINHLIPRIKKACSSIFNVEISDIDVDFACSHFVNTYVSKEGTSRGCETKLQVVHRPSQTVLYTDIPNRLKTYEKYETSLKDTIFSLCKDKSASGQIRNQMIATDCAEIVRYLIDPKSEGFIHVPGLEGLVGGLRGYAHNQEIVIANSDFSVDERVEANREGLCRDGVVLLGNGIIQFTDDVIYKMKKVFDLTYPVLLPIEDFEEFAGEVRDVLNNYQKS